MSADWQQTGGTIATGLTRRAFGRRATLFAAGGAATTSVLGLAACGAGGAGSATSGETVAVPKVRPGTTVRLHVRTGNEADTLKERLPVLEAEQGVKTEIEAFGQNEYYEKIQVLLAGDSIGDVVWGSNSTGQGALWAFSNTFRYADDLIKAEKFDLSAYYPSAVEGVKFEGKAFGLPFKFHPGPMAIYYNVDAFTKEGQKAPDGNLTFDQVAELARKMTQPGIRWGFRTGDNNPGYQWAVNYARTWGTDIISADGKKSQLAQPQVIQGLQWVHDMMYRHRAAPTWPPKDASFEQGQVAMLQSTSSSKNLNVRVKDFTVMDVLMPKGPTGKRGSMGVTDFLSITRSSKNATEGWALVKHLCDKETGIRLGEGGASTGSGTSGARKDVFQSERLLANPLHKIWIEAAETAQPLLVPFNFLGEEHQKVLNEGLNPIFKGEVPLNQSTLAEIDRRLQVVLDKPRPGR
ncbi:MAG: hypothetical protein AVDCRST_MAG77-156 [uncultured Chloroflexi bacterium]|uniref:Uncharacterized protein n=1 Tax=uncultured Chloroflexota bacterium TaxID=166587 RepID=A0A6J4H4W2_9CHLR|nr:MAG: hypothetical protein AVDCRST_MAG77-156 [uncultured Chloroflexota bacterium]